MQTYYLDEVGSTQTYLKELILEKDVEFPCAVVAKIQTNGIGSRGNSWTGMEGNLFLSFGIPLAQLPKDLKIESASIYYAYLLKETLCELNSKVWLKWPNDFYVDNKKIGGMITNISKGTLICGVGINLVQAPEGFATLDLQITQETILKRYFLKLQKNVSWKQVFSKYKLEFDKSKEFYTHNKNIKISLEGAILESDGSVTSNGERIFSLR